MNNKDIAEMVLEEEHVRKGKTLQCSRGWLKETIIKALQYKDGRSPPHTKAVGFPSELS